MSREKTKDCRLRFFAGIRVIIDFIPNHMSNKSTWFQYSESRKPGYEDYFVWRDGTNDGGRNSTNFEPGPPNNWV